MSSSQFGASFNHSCLRVPVNPSNHLPYTSYERKQVSSTSLEEGSTNKVNTMKNAHFQGVGQLRPRPSRFLSDEQLAISPLTSTSPINRKVNPKEIISSRSTIPDPSVPANETGVKESFESFIKFYENIPDYKDVDHLTDREFNIKVQGLREKQREYLNDTDSKFCSPSSPVDRPSKSTSIYKAKKKNQKKKEVVHSNSNIISKIPYQSAIKNCDQKRYVKSNDYSKSSQRKTHFQRNQGLWDKRDEPESVGTPSTASVASEMNIDCQRKTHGIIPVSSKCSLSHNNDISDSDSPYESRLKSSEDINELGLKENHGILSSPLDLGLYRSNYPKNGETNSRVVYSAMSSKNVRSSIVDSSSSIIDSVWDGFSIDDCLPKSECLYSDSESIVGITYPFVRSLPNSPVLKPYKTVAWKESKITVPEPFEMTVRDEEEANYKTREQEIYSAAELKDESKHFKANPVPLHAQIPLYDKIVFEQEKRRRKLKLQCMSELRSQMKPFSFVKRDEEQRRNRLTHSTPELREPKKVFPKPFKAKPVPKNLFGSLVYQRMREDEFYRALKRKIRSEELLRNSSLPPSMAAREHISQAVCESTKYHDNSPERSSKKSHKIPNYKKSHDLMRRELDERLSDNVSTSTQPFYLRTGQLRSRRSKRSSSMIESTSSSPYECYSSLLTHQRLRPRSALCHSANRNNLAAVLRIQSARQRLEREASLKQEEIKKKEEIRLKAHTARCKPVWRSINYSTNEDLALRVQTRREEERMRREQHEQEMELMLYRVERIPTLFQRQTQMQQSKKSQKCQKSHLCSSIAYHKRSLTYSSPDLFGSGGGAGDDSNRSEVTDDKSSKQSKIVSINETAQTIRSSSKPNENKGKAEKETANEMTREGDDDSSIQEDLPSAGESYDEEDNEVRNDCKE